jgi:hypothetical protein
LNHDSPLMAVNRESQMQNPTLAALIAASMAFAGIAQAQTPRPAAQQSLSKADYEQAIKNADAQYKSANDACKSLSGNAKDVCAAEAAGNRKVAKAEAEAAYKGTPKTREAARVARADANYEVAKEKCDDFAGNPKDVCVQEAKSALVKAKADAKVDRVATDTNREAAANQASARQDAAEEKREADLKLALEKCDALAGAAKEACVNNAKARYGKR